MSGDFATPDAALECRPDGTMVYGHLDPEEVEGGFGPVALAEGGPPRFVPAEADTARHLEIAREAAAKLAKAGGGGQCA